jgi:hypothetical protein
VKAALPEITFIDQCKIWKPYVGALIKGGFNADMHPIAIETAIDNARNAYVANGYLPEPGSTPVWQLGEALLPLIKKDLDGLKERFPAPEVNEN